MDFPHREFWLPGLACAVILVAYLAGRLGVLRGRSFGYLFSSILILGGPALAAWAILERLSGQGPEYLTLPAAVFLCLFAVMMTVLGLLMRRTVKRRDRKKPK